MERAASVVIFRILDEICADPYFGIMFDNGCILCIDNSGGHGGEWIEQGEYEITKDYHGFFDVFEALKNGFSD